MATRLKIDVKRGIVYGAFDGELNDDDLLEHGAMLRRHPDFDPGFSEIVDFSRVTEMNVTMGMINAMAKGKSLFNPEAKHAVVAAQELTYEIARTYQVMAERTRPNFVVVRTLPEACRFLGIEDCAEFE